MIRCMHILIVNGTAASHKNKSEKCLNTASFGYWQLSMEKHPYY